MTDPQTELHAQQQAERSVDGLAAELLEGLATKLGAKTSVSAVFGDPSSARA